MLTTNHKQPQFTYSARLPWRRRLRALAPSVGGTGILYTYRDSGGAAWWSDGTAIFRGAAPDYLRRVYLHAGLPVDTPLASLPLSPIEALALLGPRLDEPVACYRITAGSLGSIPVDVFATDDPSSGRSTSTPATFPMPQVSSRTVPSGAWTTSASPCATATASRSSASSSAARRRRKTYTAAAPRYDGDGVL